tara:strand:+ start:297 stop:770 length:474 start_codon:yes stop_codon:yes gene_type:complete
MLKTEKIPFKITLNSSFWKDAPKFEIRVNDEIIVDSSLKQNGVAETFEFFREFTSDEKTINSFQIILKDKDKYQTVVENDKIIKDQLLTIENLEIDEMDLTSIIHNQKYYPTYNTEYVEKNPELPKFVTNTLTMGHNGYWEIQFTSPFYLWLLENLY